MSNFDLHLARLIYQSSLSPERKDYYIEHLVRGTDFRQQLALELARENERLSTKLADFRSLGHYLRGRQSTFNISLDELDKTELGSGD